jgi:hypothetical protein
MRVEIEIPDSQGRHWLGNPEEFRPLALVITPTIEHMNANPELLAQRLPRVPVREWRIIGEDVDA